MRAAIPPVVKTTGSLAAIFIETREEAVEAGYVPCKRCNP
jgi:methylphosphotriester-DNA--protein-cysteine methyltransferase